MELELQLLGPFMAVYDGRPLDSFRSNKTQALLAYLVTEAGFANEGQSRPHGREHLMTLLWPRTPQKSAQANLRQTLYQLRQTIPYVAGPDGKPVAFLLSDRKQVQVNSDAPYDLDVARFLRLLDGELSPDELAQAVTLYRGPFLADFHLPDSETFEEWAAARRATLQRMALEALEALTEHHLERAENEEAERYARRQVDLDELRESGHRQLLRALSQQGKRNAALAHYDEYCALLEQELGVEPSAEIEGTYEAVREGGAAAVAPTVRGDPGVRKKRGRLPQPATTFVGRQKEFAQVAEQLANGCRLLTLLGPGGGGKSRLALEFARRRADEYARGAAFVDLAPLSDPANIPIAIATALDFRFTSEGSRREQVLNYLANKELLLILDNFEHLLHGAALVSDLLEAAPDVHIIATSRARLNLGSECLFEVGGLAWAEDGLQQEDEEGDFETSEAVALFMERARRVEPGFAVEEADKVAVARICRLVEGMPLAIEIAASWVRYLPPADIVQELAHDLGFLESDRADLPARQHSMQATFDHSWKLLGEDERQALMKLSVFRGGAGREAASAVVGAPLHTLVALADHSLLSRDPNSGRFAVHELIRQFAAERLEEAGEADEVRDAHSTYYLQALAGRLPDLKGRDQLGALEAIEDDFENVRAAWRWALRLGKWEDFPEASQSLFLFAFFRGRYQDGIELFDLVHQGLPSPNTGMERLAHAYAIASRAWLLNWIGGEEEALAAVPELEAAVAALMDPAAVAFCQLMLGDVLIYQGEYPAKAIAALQAARAYYRAVGDSFYRALGLWRLGVAHFRSGEEEEGTDLTRRGLPLAQEVGDRFVASALLNNLGAFLGNQEAIPYYREAADLAWEIGAPAGYAFSLVNLAYAFYWRGGDVDKSRPMLEEAQAIAAEQNNPLVRVWALSSLSELRLLEGEYEEVLALTAEALAIAKRDTDDWCYAIFARGVAFLALGDIHQAVPLMKEGVSWYFVSSRRLRDRLSGLKVRLAYCAVIFTWQGEHEWGAELLALGQTASFHGGGLEVDRLLTRTRAELEEVLGEEAFAAAWERGELLDPVATAKEVLAALEQIEAAG